MNFLVRFVIIFIILSTIFSVFTNSSNNGWDSPENGVGVLEQPKISVEQSTSADVKEDSVQNDDFIKDVKPSQTSITTDYPGNYIDRVTVYGNLQRWNPETFPLEVYIENNPELPGYYYKEVKKAFEQWQKATKNYIAFVYTDFEHDADIRCTFLKNFDKEINNKGMVIGHSSFEITDGIIQYSEIEFAVYRFKNQYFKSKEIYRTALHEIGHSLGIQGHSINPDDIMYPSVKRNKLSLGDINTLRLLYSIVPNISNKEFSSVAKENLAEMDDIFGDYDLRIYSELQNTKEDILHSFGSKSNIERLSTLYLKTKNYSAAAQNFEKLLSSTTDLKTKEDIYRNLIFCYDKLNDYDKAIDSALKAYEISHEPDFAVFAANLYLKFENYSAAAENYEKAIFSSDDLQNEEWIYKNLAFCYKKLNDYNNALDSALKAYEINYDPNIAVFIAKTYYDLEDYENAKILAKDVLKLHPDTYNMYIILAKIYKEENNSEGMNILIEQAKLNFPENPPVFRSAK